jgi:hypothetical protein
MKKEPQRHEGDRIAHENHRLNKREELKTDHPLSEKDQVKEAEERQRKRAAKSKEGK